LFEKQTKRSIDEEDTLFPRDHCATGGSGWTHPARNGIGIDRKCRYYPVCQCYQFFIRDREVGEVNCLQALLALPCAWDERLLIMF
jgi:hypothetical protein